MDFDTFIGKCREICSEYTDQVDIVCHAAPLMAELLAGDRSFLKQEHFACNEESYSRNAVFICPQGEISLFSMVWNPGQFTPIHDHGTWGTVGVVKGSLTEQGYIRVDNRGQENSGIKLIKGGYLILAEGSVATFVASPDHIHVAGVPEHMEQAVTLHLYGRNMDEFNIYDLEAGTRAPFHAECSEAGLLKAGEEAKG